MKGRWLINSTKLGTNITSEIAKIGTDKINFNFECIYDDVQDEYTYKGNNIFFDKDYSLAGGLKYSLNDGEGGEEYDYTAVYNFKSGNWSQNADYLKTIDIKDYNNINKEFLYKFLTNYATKEET